jgi:hypothetical protein
MSERSPIFVALRDDIGEHDLRRPVVRHQGEVLEGRNRYRACLASGREPRFADCDGTNAEARDLLISENLRQHLNYTQRLNMAVRMVTSTYGGDRGTNQHGDWQVVKKQLALPEVTHAKAADWCNVSKTAVDQSRSSRTLAPARCGGRSTRRLAWARRPSKRSPP